MVRADCASPSRSASPAALRDLDHAAGTVSPDPAADKKGTLFLYVVIDRKKKDNLAMARYKVSEVRLA